MINLIKNKLRSAGQRDPMVMAVDACEERTPAKDAPAFDIMRPGGKNSPYDKDGKPKGKLKPKATEPPNMKGVPFHGKRPPTGPKGGESQRNKPKPHKSTYTTPKYNPYGKGATATPENMVPGKP